VPGAVVVLYAPVLARMVTTWYRQEAASHGFLVPLIARYLA